MTSATTKRLNTKNPKARALADALIALTGETLKDAVTIALRERLVREYAIRDMQPSPASALKD